MAQLAPRPDSSRLFVDVTRRAVALAVLVVGVAAGSSCGTDAVGVGSCRDIEHARCEAAVACGMIDDAESCKRYYNDHCLHGVALDDGPGSVAVRNCVRTIEAAGRCADEEGKSTDPANCDSSWLEDANATRVCDIVEEPERATDCAFLVPDPEDEDDKKKRDERDDDDEDAGGTKGDAG